jgi:hypothetical protein
MFMLLALGRTEDSLELALEITYNLKDAILLLKDVIVEEYDTEDLRRLSFDVFLSVLVQGVHRLAEYNPIDLALENLSLDQQKDLESQRFFRLSRQIEESGIKLVADDLLETYVGGLDPIKSTLLEIATGNLQSPVREEVEE